MTTPVDIQTTPEQLVRLAELCEITNNTLSPIPPIADTIDTKFDSPLPQEWYDEKGAIRSEIALAMKGVAATRSLTYLEFQSKYRTFRMTAYYPEELVDDGISLTDTGDGIRVQQPPSIESAVEIIGLHTGESFLGRIDLDIDLPIADTLVFMAVVDAGRRRRLSGILDAPQNEHITLKDIHHSLTAKSETAPKEWLTQIFSENMDLKMPERQDVLHALDNLEGKKLITRKDKTWELSDPVQSVVEGLLVLDSSLHLRTAKLNKNAKPDITDIHVVSGFANAHLLWSNDDKEVKLAGLGSMHLLTMLYDQIRPAIITDDLTEEDNQPAKAEQDQKFCTGCGEQLGASDNFCAKCGQAT